MRQTSTGSDSPYATVKHDELIIRDILAADRTVLANERTLLAYARTAIALVATGAGIIHLFANRAADLGGILLITMGAVVMLVGIKRFVAVRRDLSAFRPRR